MSETTNQYWNKCIQSIRRFYPANIFKIVVIDDNSNQDFLKEDHPYRNVTIIKSEFPARGEILAFYYLYKYRFFQKAVIIHDSVFFQKRIRFDRFVMPVLPFWHFSDNLYENKEGTLSLVQRLRHREKLVDCLTQNSEFFSAHTWTGCFGLQCFITYQFVSLLHAKYNLFSLLQVIRSRRERCCMERVMGILFVAEYPLLKRVPSLFGNIYSYEKWGLSYHEYQEILRKKNNSDISKKPLVKVWTGR
jgi:hypothetical protein